MQGNKFAPSEGGPQTSTAPRENAPNAFQTFRGIQGHSNARQVVVWMPAPMPIPNCPPGLEYLTQIDQIVINQQYELLEAFISFETHNKYEIKNIWGQRIYFAMEDSDWLIRNCCGSIRPVTLRIENNLGQVVIEILRPLRCGSCLWPCCLQEIEVHAPPGVPIGHIRQIWHPFLPKFAIHNEANEEVLKMVGPCLVSSCSGDINFELKSVDEIYTVGKISKRWSGFVKEIFTDADNFAIQFPLDLDVKMKAVMIGACFLIDFMFFEDTATDPGRGTIW